MITLCTPEQKSQVLEYFRERLGIADDTFAAWEFYAGPNGRILLGPRTDLDLGMVDTAGILVARISRTVKPGTNLFQMFGHLVTRSIVRVTRENAEAYCLGKDFDVSAGEIGDSVRGFVMVAFDNLPLGCGLLKDGRIENQLPKPNRMKLDRF